MRTREKSYTDFGFSDRAEAQEWLLHCRNLEPKKVSILQESAQQAYPAVAPLLVESLLHGVSYGKMMMSVEIPVSEVDFYAYRRMTLGIFRQKIEEKRGTT